MISPDAAERIERTLRLAGLALGGQVRFVEGAVGGEPVWRSAGDVGGSLFVDAPGVDPSLRRAVLADTAAVIGGELSQGNLDGLVRQLVAAREAAETVAERMRLAVSASGIGTALLDDSGRLIFVNPAFAALVGRDPGDLIDRAFDDLIRADDTETAASLIAAMRDGEGVLIEYEGHIVAEGSRPVRLHRGRMATADGGDAELVQIEDITEQRDLQVELHRAAAESRAALDALDQGVALIDSCGRVRRANPALRGLLGLRPEDVVELEAVREARSTGLAVRGHIETWADDAGRHHLLRVSVVPLDDGSGAVVVAVADTTAEDRARRLLDATLEAAPVGLAVIDPERRILRCNSMFVEQSGRPADELLGMDVTDLLVDEDDRARARARAAGAVRAGSEGRLRSEARRVVRPDGSEIWVTTHVAILADPDQPRGIVVTFDVTEERRLHRDLARYEHLFHHANDVITVVDPAGRVLSTSPSTTRVLGYPEQWSEPGGVLGLVHPDDEPLARRELVRLAGGEQVTEPFTVRVRAADGTWRHLECVGVNLLDEPTVGGIVLTSRDTTERALLTARLAHGATHDALTDLANRTLLEVQLDGALARALREDRQVAVCFVDLDGFKGVNDSYGHDMGDRLLVEVANRLRRAIRSGDLAARIGGDEFVVLLDPVDGPDEALAVATRVRDALVADMSSVLPGLRCGASVGVALSDIDDTPATMLRRADAALYRAKSSRRSAVEFADELRA